MRAVALLAAALAIAPSLANPPGVPPLPATLQGTGFFALEKAPFSPQYPLWSDGTTKRRWIHLPPGTAIDAAKPDAWEFPAGTRLWKQFGYDRPVETRYLERLADGTWRYAAYAWNAEGTQAALVPEDGLRGLPAKGAPEGRYAIPSRHDCIACHEGAAVPVLGFTALQLSPERDPLAPHADANAGDPLDLRRLVARGWLRNLPARLLESPPRIAAANATERAALGYLHGNCGHCHNDGALPGVDFTLAHEAARPDESAARVRASLVGADSRYRGHGAATARRVVPGDPSASVIVQRLKSANPMVRMPPLGVRVEDGPAVRLIEGWILNLEQSHGEVK